MYLIKKSNTDQYADEFLKQGFSKEDARKLATTYISVKAFDKKTTEFSNDVLNVLNHKVKGRKTDYIKNLKDLLAADFGYKEKLPRETTSLGKIMENRKIKQRGTFSIGCAFDGIQSILEYEDANTYIPSSYHCGLKCLAKFREEDFKTYPTEGMNPFGITATSLRKYATETLLMKEQDIPSLVKLNLKDNKLVLQTLDKKAMNNVNACIFLLRVNEVDEYHAILIKNPIAGKKLKLSNIDFEIVIDKVSIGINKELTEETCQMTLPPIKTALKSYYVYDIETCSVEMKPKELTNEEILEGKKSFIPRLQVPMGVGFAYISNSVMGEIQIKKGRNCLQEFLDVLASNHVSKDFIIIYAHNGGSFDNIFIKGLKDIKIIDVKASGGNMKELTIIYKDVKMSFRDSCAHLQASLKDCAMYFKLKNTKMEFDIVNKSEEWFNTNTEWIDYLKKDVEVLAEICMCYEKYINVFGASLTTSLGIAGIAWKTMCKMCLGLDYTYLPKDPTTSRFIRQSLYGGRIIHWKKRAQNLICLDANSLYPSAMTLGTYPKGKHYLIKDEEHFFMLKKQGFLYIAELCLDGHNIRYPLMPYRTEEGNLFYPSNKFQGVYNSVDVAEAETDGYTIDKFIRGIYWKDSGDIFSLMIKHFYEKRKECQKEGNPIEYVFKILLNSMYGKTLEIIKSKKTFSYEEPEDNYILLPNGQYESSTEIKNPVSRKPTHIGSFITAYSRAIMNDLVRKVRPENVVYGDTDSLYITRESFEKSGLSVSNELGGFKNDYDDKFITDGIFLDLKRYYLEFDKPDKKGNSCKYKFNGINFKKPDCMANYNTEEKLPKDKLVKKLYEDFLNQKTEDFDNIKPSYEDRTLVPEKEHLGHEAKILQEKWLRTKTEVVIVEKELVFYVGKTRRFVWKDNDAYPFDFNFNKPETYPSVVPAKTIQKTTPFIYHRGEQHIKSALPLGNSKDIEVDIITSYLRDNEGNLLYTKKHYGKSLYYKADQVYGAYEEVEEPITKKNVVAVKGLCLYNLTEEERDKIQTYVKVMMSHKK